MISKGPYLKPLKREDTPELEPTYQALIQFLGFVPDTELIMARMPRTTKALIDFVMTIFTEISLPQELLYLLGLLSSSAAGCEYCASHNVSKANDIGIDPKKLGAVWEFETNPLFSASERAALSFAFKVAQSPSTVEASDYADMAKHFTEREVTEVLFVVCQFAVFNRFNSAVAATIEPVPLALSTAQLPKDRWQPGKHDA